MGALNCYYILVWWIFFIPLLDAEICEFYEKVMDWDWNNWNTSAINKKYSRIRYKIQRSSFYCYSNQYCCWKDCCNKYKTESYEDDEDKTKLSTASVWGIIIGVTVGSCLFLACCVQLCKSDHTAQTTIPMRVARSDDGTVIVRQGNLEEPNASASMPLFPDGQNTMQHSRSTLDDNSCSERAVPGNQTDLRPMSSPNEYNNRLSHTTDYTLPPPSYEYVMSHDFPGCESQHLNKKTD